jgi:hypothetical protein
MDFVETDELTAQLDKFVGDFVERRARYQKMIRLDIQGLRV